MRAAQIDDIFVLLTPSTPLTSAETAWQNQWQKIHGGSRTDPLHVSLQRFVCADQAQLAAVVNALQTATAQLAPVPIVGVDLRSFYSAFRGKEILKCRAERTKPLQILDTIVRRTVLQNGLTPHYQEPVELITVLEGNTEALMPTPQPLPFPQPLFVGSRLVVSQVVGQEEYRLIAEWELPE